MSTVLVTGASGFIGRHVVAEVAARAVDVVALRSGTRALSEDAPRSPRITWRAADLADRAAVDALLAEVRPSQLLHLAWPVTPEHFWTGEENVDAVSWSAALFQSFAQHGGKRAVGVGTCAEYDWSRGGPLAESVTPLVPATLYGAAKHALCLLAESYFAQLGVSFAWGRIFFLYGPHEPAAKVTSAVIRSLLAGQPAHCTEGRQIRDYLHVADVAAGLVELLLADVTGPLNLGSGVGVSVRAIVETIADALDGRARVVFGARELGADEPPSLVADVQQRERVLAWRPRVGLPEGIAHLIRWCQSEGSGR
jgi:nucleoside-diphosphate-sugar epimerase